MPDIITADPHRALTHLDPDTEYTITVSACRYGQCSKPATTTARTAPDGIKRLPKPAHLTEHGKHTKTSFAVEFDAVKGVDAKHGDHGYEVTVTLKGGGEAKGITVGKLDFTTPDRPFATLTGAQAGTVYTVSVKADGDGTKTKTSDPATLDVTTHANDTYGAGGYGDTPYGGTDG
ncbi:fibronectin type III domain-containing protein [Streptomyces sp. NBC_01304]|uniref:fibronectin type III domain-containing protein n=1 Tax=Streptomyces sp. NBC_01304 TaxID=2903818 RepID=UPI002E120378|nr:fibronectin type III domain-containing protein [Streptomyces sp. NBC_01304]